MNACCGQPLDINSTARHIRVYRDSLGGGQYHFTPTQRSYYNFGGACEVPGLNQYVGQFVTTRMNQNPQWSGRPHNPPDGRDVDDQGDDVRQNVPAWLDIYYHEQDTTIGIDPRLIDAMGRHSTWRDLFGGDPAYPDDPIRVYP